MIRARGKPCAMATDSLTQCRRGMGLGQDAAARGAHTEQLDAAGRQDLEEVDDIKVIDQGVRQLYEGFRQTPFPIHSLASQSSSSTIPRMMMRTPGQQWWIWVSADRCQEGPLRRHVGEARRRAST